MPTIAASTLASHMTAQGVVYPANHSVHTLFRGGRPSLAADHTRYTITASRICAGTPTTNEHRPFSYATKTWSIEGVTTREDGKVLVSLVNRGRGRSCDRLSATLVLDPSDSIYIGRRCR